MAVYSDLYIKSILFDKKLIELGGWSTDLRNEIEKWNETTDYELQKSRAANLISYMILKILGKDCSSNGKIRIKRLGKSLANFEQIIISSRDLERKFYRDHLNHAIRVALIARAIGKRRPFSLSSKELDMLVLSSLFHDVAYPLSKIFQCFKFAIKAVRSCYNIASDALMTRELKLELNADKMADILSISKHICRQRLVELEHGLLSSLELVSYLKDDEDPITHYEEAIKAIAFHDPSVNSEVDPKKKILSLLILADELQDWGRPISYPLYHYVIPKIKDFELDDYNLSGEYETRDIPGYSLLRQICGKTQSLARLKLHKELNLALKFSFDNFVGISLIDLEKSLQEMFDKCAKLEMFLSPKNFPKLYVDDSNFEKIFYGMSISKEIKSRLFRLLHNRQLCSDSPLQNLQFFINDSAKDLVAFEKHGIKSTIRHLQLRTFSGQIRFEVLSDKIFEGKIETIDSSKISSLCMMLLSEIRFFNICAQKISKFLSENYPVDIAFEEFPDEEDIIILSKEMKDLNFSGSLDILPKIRDCISTGGFFFVTFPTKKRAF